MPLDRKGLLGYVEIIKFRENTILAKWRINLSFTDIGKSCPSHDFLTYHICLLTLFAKIKFSRKFPDLQYSKVTRVTSDHS